MTNALSTYAFVLVPGMRGGKTPWERLVALLRENFPAEFDSATFHVLPQLATQTSMKDPIDYSRLAEAHLDRWMRDHPEIENVVLVGHSFGGLLARRAWLNNWNSSENSEKDNWARRVRAFVLAGSPDRGINYGALARPLRWTAAVLSAIGFLQLWTLHELRRGSNFVTNLRIDWMERIWKLERDNPFAIPRTVHLVSVMDEIIQRDDCLDEQQFTDYSSIIEVPDATHTSLLRVDIRPDPAAGLGEWRTALLRAADSEFRPSGMEFGDRPNEADDIVFLLHGIRAYSVAAPTGGHASS